MLSQQNNNIIITMIPYNLYLLKNLNGIKFVFFMSTKNLVF